MIVEVFNPEILSRANTLVCLDRDDTIVKDYDYMNGSSRIELNTRLIKDLLLEFPKWTSFCLISNQSGIERELISINDVFSFNRRLYLQLKSAGIALTLSVFCPHAPSSDCLCRKPKPLMLSFVRDLHSKLMSHPCIFFGDKLSDKMASEASEFTFREVRDFSH